MADRTKQTHVRCPSDPGLPSPRNLCEFGAGTVGMQMSYNDDEKQFLIWLHAVSTRFLRMTYLERINTLDTLISLCGAKELLHLCDVLPSFLYRDFLMLELLHLCDVLPSFLYRDFLRLLPSEIGVKILLMLDEKSILNCCLVSKHWNSLVHSNREIWLKLAVRAGARLYLEPASPIYKVKAAFLQTTSLIERMKTKTAFDVMTLEGHRGRVMAITCNRDIIATGSDDHTVRFWDVYTGDCIKLIHTHSVSALQLDSINVYTASYDNTAASWDIDTGQQSCRFVGHVSAVFSLDARRNMNLLVTGSADKTVKLWQLSTGVLLNSLSDWHNDWITQVRILSYVSADIRHPADVGVLEHGTLQLVSVDRQCCCFWTLRQNENVDVSVTHSADWCMHVPINTQAYRISICTNDKKDRTQLLSTYVTETVKDKCVPRHMSSIAMPKDLPVKQTVLGMGQKFAAFMVDEGYSRVVVVDILTDRVMCSIPVPPYRPTQNGASATLGSPDWLDGFTETNRCGLFLALCLKDNSIQLLKWKDNG